MSRAMFQRICEMLHPYIKKDCPIRDALTTEHRIAVTIYYLATTVEYRTVGNLFGIHRSTVCCVVHEVCYAICTHVFPDAVKFPTGTELKKVISGFQKKWRFPNCGGAIDATHIPIIAPQQFHADYVNRKGWYSVILQAVCDDKYKFTDVCIGWPGRVHDARVFSNSAFKASADAGRILPQSPEWKKRVGTADNVVDMPVVIIADPAYRMSHDQWLLKPYSNRGTLSDEKSYFNFRLSSARMVIENTFGRFKGRWRRFMRRIDLDVDFVPTVVVAAVAVHNMCESDHMFNPDWLDEVEVHADDQGPQGQEDTTGSAVRDALALQFAEE
ncbi:uncharacterized protein [Haliotis asinina]|uniref:uncharacterized protein n=1 Tax=Haliotis asinina TaxID=109174 RepID=UPI00353249F7